MKTKIIGPVSYDKTESCVNDVFGELVCEPGDPTGEGVDKVGRYIALCLNQHADLLAEVERQDLEIN